MKKMAKGESLRLADREATEIEVVDGCVWVTQERDAEDYIVTSGRVLRVARPSRAVISALKPALVHIRACAA